jgi:hypothetical protein
VNRHLVLAATLAALLAGCGGSDTSTPVTGAGDTPVSARASVPAPASAPGDTDAPAGSDTGAAPSAGVPADVCATVPSLEAMNAVLDEPVTTVTALPRGGGEAACEATGDGASSVQFGVLAGVTTDAMRDQAAQIGATVTDLADPAGGFAYAATAVAVIDGTAYSVQAITIDVITDPNTPEAIERSAGLLRQWLALMGLA